jgi:uncharacterized protein DUF5677
LEERGINRLRFEEAEALSGEGSRLIDETGRSILQGSSVLLVAQVTRATHTFEAVVEACRIGRGVQASMLNRSLFEDVLDIHWVAENPDVAPSRADEHDRLMAFAEHQMEVKFGRSDRQLTEDEIAEFNKLIATFGGIPRAFKTPWTRASFEERLALVHTRWQEESEARHFLDYIYQVIQRQNNLLLHSSPTAYRQTLHMRPDGQRDLNRAGPDSRWNEALSHGAGGIYMACRVLAQEFDFDVKPMAEVFSQTTNYCRSLDELSGIRELPLDALCPCGSRRFVAKCHLS